MKKRTIIIDECFIQAKVEPLRHTDWENQLVVTIEGGTKNHPFNYKIKLKKEHINYLLNVLKYRKDDQEKILKEFTDLTDKLK